MELKLGFLTSEQSLSVMTLETDNKEVTSEKTDFNQLNNYALNLLVYSDDIEHLGDKIQDQARFFPIASFQQLENIGQTTQTENYDDLLNLYHSVSERWVFKNNLNTIENLVPVSRYMRNLWQTSRHNFFEELWYLLKTNTKCAELNLIFHDLKETKKAKEEDKDIKPELCYSIAKGKKVPSLEPGSHIEENLMQDYEADFSQPFNITEYDRNKGQMVACAKIDLSPILIMARVNDFTPLQESIFEGIFSGLQKPTE